MDSTFDASWPTRIELQWRASLNGVSFCLRDDCDDSVLGMVDHCLPDNFQ